MNKRQFSAALVFAALLILFAVHTHQRYQLRKQTEAEIASRHAAGEAAYASGSGTKNGAAGEAGAGTGEVDYGLLSSNSFSEQLAFRRPQPFAGKEVLYNGKRYVRNTAVKALLLMGLDRRSDDLSEIRPELWEQGQTDLMLVLAHNTSRNTVKVLQIPRDTMAAMKAVTYEGQKKGDTVEQITLAFSYGDGVYKSCELSCDAVTRLLGGLEMEHYMLADMRSINTLNDLVGGVTVTIPDDRAVWKDPAFEKGKTITLVGGQAEEFVRRRDHSDDLSSLLRMEHQRIYLEGFQAKVKQCVKEDPDFLEELFDAAEADLLSDMNRKEYVKLAGSILNSGQLDEKDFIMLPGDARMGEVYLEYVPRYADIDKEVLELFYREVK